jgi:hypothetical protein
MDSMLRVCLSAQLCAELTSEGGIVPYSGALQWMHCNGCTAMDVHTVCTLHVNRPLIWSIYFCTQSATCFLSSGAQQQQNSAWHVAPGTRSSPTHPTWHCRYHNRSAWHSVCCPAILIAHRHHPHREHLNRSSRPYWTSSSAWHLPHRLPLYPSSHCSAWYWVMLKGCSHGLPASAEHCSASTAMPLQAPCAVCKTSSCQITISL